MATIGIHGRVVCRSVQRPDGSGTTSPEPYVELHFDTHSAEPGYIGRDNITFYPRNPEDLRQWAAAISAAADDLEDAIGAAKARAERAEKRKAKAVEAAP